MDKQFVDLFSKKPALKCGLIQPAPGETYDPNSDIIWLTKAWMTAPPPADKGKGLTRMVFDGQNLLKGSNKVSVIDARPRPDGNTALIFDLPVVGQDFSKEGKHTFTITLRDTYGRTCNTGVSFKTSRAKPQNLSSPSQGVAGKSVVQRAGHTSFSATASSCGISAAMYIPYFIGDDQTKVWYSPSQKSIDAPKWAIEVNNNFNLNQTFQTNGLLTPTVAITSTPTLAEQPPSQGGTGPGKSPIDTAVVENADGFIRLMDTNGNPWGIGINLTSAKLLAFVKKLKAQHPNPNEIVAIVVDYILKLPTSPNQSCVGSNVSSFALPDLGIAVISPVDLTAWKNVLEPGTCTVNAVVPIPKASDNAMAFTWAHELGHLHGLGHWLAQGNLMNTGFFNATWGLTMDQAANYLVHTLSAPDTDCSTEGLFFTADYGHPYSINPSYTTMAGIFPCGNGQLDYDPVYSSVNNPETCEYEYLDGGQGPKNMYPSSWPGYSQPGTVFGIPVSPSGLPSHRMDWTKPAKICVRKDPNGAYCQRTAIGYNSAVDTTLAPGIEYGSGDIVAEESCDVTVPGSCTGIIPQCIMQPPGGGQGPNLPPTGHSWPTGSYPYSYGLGQCWEHCGDGVFEPQLGEQCDSIITEYGDPNCSLIQPWGLNNVCNNCKCQPPVTYPPVEIEKEPPPPPVCGNGIDEVGEQCDPSGETCKFVPKGGGLGVKGVCDDQCQCGPSDPPPKK